MKTRSVPTASALQEDDEEEQEESAFEPFSLNFVEDRSFPQSIDVDYSTGESYDHFTGA